MAALLGSYQNGNYTVHLFEDGTKIRHNKSDHFSPVFPESIDLKICNRCDMRCSYCHEESVPDGKLADLNARFLDTLHPYTELAIGGGNPLEHPDLESFLMRMKKRRVVCNMTVHAYHATHNEELLRRYCDEGLIHGLGISLPTSDVYLNTSFWKIAKLPNAVIHAIAGTFEPYQLRDFYNLGYKLLILGYKTYGRGMGYYGVSHVKIQFKIKQLLDGLPSLFNGFSVVSFDNLALRQLNVREVVGEDVWKQNYMGDDGQFTMYIDLVKQEYAVSSTSPRHKIVHDNVDDMFAEVGELRNREFREVDFALPSIL